MRKCRKSWRVRSRAILFGLVALAGCSREPKNLPAVTPVTSKEVLQATHNTEAKAVLVNMWASWCGPCRMEFPDLVKLQRDYEARGLKVVFVSWDDNAQIAAKFLAQQGVTTPSFIKTDAQNDQDFINGVSSNLTGAIPATLIYDSTGKLRDMWEGAVSYEEFAQKVNAVLGGQT
jgi:thiol-disulfide isomerase/thioredoxin